MRWWRNNLSRWPACRPVSFASGFKTKGRFPFFYWLLSVNVVAAILQLLSSIIISYIKLLIVQFIEKSILKKTHYLPTENWMNSYPFFIIQKNLMVYFWIKIICQYSKFAFLSWFIKMFLYFDPYSPGWIAKTWKSLKYK